jgi:hypothetical protein
MKVRLRQLTIMRYVGSRSLNRPLQIDCRVCVSMQLKTVIVVLIVYSVLATVWAIASTIYCFLSWFISTWRWCYRVYQRLNPLPVTLPDDEPRYEEFYDSSIAAEPSTPDLEDQRRSQMQPNYYSGSLTRF